MPGSPKKRQRREAALAAPPPMRAAGTDPASRAAAVARAGEVGDAAAAGEYRVASSTIRSWRRRQKSANGGTLPAVAGVPAAPAPLLDGDGLEQMKDTAAQARQIVSEAARRTRELQTRGEDVPAREAAASAKLWSGTVHSLESAIAVSEASRRRLSESHAAMIAGVLTEFSQAIGVSLDHRSSMSSSVRAFLRELLGAAQAGDELAALPGAARAVAEVRAHWLEELRPAIAAELRAPEPVEVDREDESDAPLLDEPDEDREADEDVGESEDPAVPAREPAQDRALAAYCSIYRDSELAARELARDRADGRHVARLSEWGGVL